jgi:hypothetical protein
MYFVHFHAKKQHPWKKIPSSKALDKHRPSVNSITYDNRFHCNGLRIDIFANFQTSMRQNFLGAISFTGSTSVRSFLIHKKKHTKCKKVHFFSIFLRKFNISACT